MYDIIPSFITAFLITFFAIPSIIKIAIEKNLCDEPGERRSHTQAIPTLGGLGIFAGLIFAITFWIPFDTGSYPNIQYILCAYIIVFLIGAKDDIIPLTPLKKFAGQILAAFILVYKAKIRLTSLYGILGITILPEWVSVMLTIITIIMIINALNLIDGINGLAGTIGIIISGTLGYWFYQYGRLDLAILAASTIGALVAFLYYNITPAKIFMGDTGSLLVGLTTAILAISFIEENQDIHNRWFISSVPAVAIAVLIIPLFDTLRVFTTRILKRKSPFRPDRTHIHHLLLDLGFSHMQGTITLAIVNIGFIILAYSLSFLGTLEVALIIFTIAALLTGGVFVLVNRKK